MAKIFLDTNIFIDLIEERQEIILDELDKDNLFISPLSVHILMYVTKNIIPYERLNKFINSFTLVVLDEDVIYKSMAGPTPDLEDNIQLHSAAEADCDLFLTEDQELLKMKFFGKTQILPTPS